MRDVIIAAIPKMQTTTCVTSDPKNFLMVGSISEAMVSRVPANNPIIVEYMKSRIDDKGDDSGSLQEELPKKKRKSSKHKGKFGGDGSKKSKKLKKRKLTQVVVEEESSEHNQSLVHNEKESPINDEKGIENGSQKTPIILEPILTSVSTPIVPSLMDDEAGIIKQVVDDPLLTLSQTPPTPPIHSNISHSTPIPTSTTFDPTSHDLKKPFEIPIFKEATITSMSKTTSTKEPPPEEDELHPKLNKEQLVEQAKHDFVLDELHALNEKIIAEKVEQKNVESGLTDKKSMFPD
ncbi:unnamed protein product [Lactuca virosa]|uniref:Uncharacterized protein n=1 Tax=Lactuca virosa TaxID=75947 RepID=A0AAU9M2L6_9ASTR|nr:unnamed protein product [Lactuca virosa]